MMRPDYGNLRLKGDEHRLDSFSLTMQAVARLFGKDVDYETIYALSTNCFAPDIRADEECRSDWRLRGRGQCLDLVSDYLGLKVRPIGCFAPRKYGEKHDLDAAKKAAAEIRGALDNGEVVVTDSGWKDTFAYWGIITGAEADGTIRGANPARADNSLDHCCSFWALSPDEPKLTEQEAVLETLKRAKARIRGNAAPFLPDSLACGLPALGAPEVAGAVVWGRPAMDLWISQMGKPAFQQDDPGSSAGNARTCALYGYDGALASEKFLRRAAEHFPKPSRTLLFEAAEHYQTIAKLLEPFSKWEKGKGYRAGEVMLKPSMGNLPWQKEHAEKVLRAVKSELTAAADRIGDALTFAETVPGQVRPEALAELACRKFMDGLPKDIAYLPAGVPLAHVQALNHSGTEIGFAEFAALSGWAFSFGYKYNDISPAFMAVCGHPKDDGPYEVFRFPTERLGYVHDGVSVREKEKFWAFVKKHVDAGTPILSEHLDGGLIYGYYEKDGARQVWFNGPVGTRWMRLEDFQPTWGFVLVHKGEALPKKELVVRALVRAVRHAAPHDWKGTLQGLAALEAYAGDVADPAKDFEKCKEYFCWAAFERLMARKCCAVWLRSATGFFDVESCALLRRAAKHYEKAYECYERYRRACGAGEESVVSFKERARTPEAIAAMVPPLREGIAAERAALKALEEALAAIGGDR